MSVPSANPDVGRFLQLREQLIRTLGQNTVDVIVQRSAAELLDIHPVLATIPLDQIETGLPEAGGPVVVDSDDDVQEAFAALSAVMLVILARMLGREVAARLVESVDASSQIGRGWLDAAQPRR